MSLRLPGLRRVGFNADRLLNRHLVLPQHVRHLTRDADFVHIADHSYAHLALALPAARVGVYCHDLDAFRAVLAPATEPRPWWFRRLVRRTLAGLRSAAVVFHSTAAVRDQLLGHGLVPARGRRPVPRGVVDDRARRSDARRGSARAFRAADARFLVLVHRNRTDTSPVLA